MKTTSDPTTELRQAIDMLPLETRIAMLDGIRSNKIIAGAYTDNAGGVCPMLAAHRNGGVTTLLSFARAWDSFADTRQTRRATRREVRVLESQLTQSLLADGEIVPLGVSTSDLSAAIADHVALKQLHEAEAQAAPQEQEQEREREQIRAARLTPGRLARLRPRRGEADAERALAHLDEHIRATTGQPSYA